jgi:chromosome segregation ATPase
MIRGILIGTALIGILLIGEWTRRLQAENHTLRAKTQELEEKLERERANYEKLYYDYIREENLVHHGTDSTDKALSDLDAQLTSAKARLEELKKSLAGLKSPGSAGDSAGSHIAQDTAALAKIQDQLQRLNSDGATVNSRSKDFRQDQQRKRQAARQDLNARANTITVSLRSVQAEIQFVRQSKGDPNRGQRLAELNAQINDLKAQQRDINGQRKALDSGSQNMDQAINQEVKGEQDEIHAERDQLLREQAQVKADIEYWKRLKSVPAEQEKQIKGLEKEIAMQTDKVAALERMIQSLKQNPAAAR